LRVIVKTGAGNTGNADFLYEIFGESNVLGTSGEARIAGWKVETRNVGHDVVRAARFVDRETGGLENFEEALTFFGVGGG